METVQELIPFTKEILSQKPTRGMVKVYLIGSVLAFFGVMLGFVETVCQPFYAYEPIDEEMAQLGTLEQQVAQNKRQKMEAATVLEGKIEGESKTKQQAVIQKRNSANRLHASS